MEFQNVKEIELIDFNRQGNMDDSSNRGIVSGFKKEAPGL